jgi:hypothetical protein
MDRRTNDIIQLNFRNSQSSFHGGVTAEAQWARKNRRNVEGMRDRLDRRWSRAGSRRSRWWTNVLIDNRLPPIR